MNIVGNAPTLINLPIMTEQSVQKYCSRDAPYLNPTDLLLTDLRPIQILSQFPPCQEGLTKIQISHSGGYTSILGCVILENTPERYARFHSYWLYHGKEMRGMVETIRDSIQPDWSNISLGANLDDMLAHVGSLHIFLVGNLPSSLGRTLYTSVMSPLRTFYRLLKDAKDKPSQKSETWRDPGRVLKRFRKDRKHFHHEINLRYV